jgi:hypothetical protein
MALLKGKQRALENPKKLFEMCKEYGILEGTYADYAQMGLSRIKSLVNKGMVLQQYGEYEIRGTLFAAELTDQEWESGKIESKHLNEIKDIIAKTQTLFTKVDSPLWMQTTIGRAIMQMARWKVTYAMLARDYAKGAGKEWAKGKTGPNTVRLARLLPIFLLGLYIEFWLVSNGYKKAAEVVKSTHEIVNNFFTIIPDTYEQVKDNPLMKYIGMSIFTMATISSYLFGTEPPRKIEINSGWEKLYIPAIRQFTETNTGTGRTSASGHRTTTIRRTK